MRTAGTAALPVDWATAEQAVVMLGLSQEVIERWRSAGMLRTKLRGSEIRIRLSSIVARARKGSLTALRPELAMYWHADLNGQLSPNDVAPDDTRAVWWTCPAKPPHVWECTVILRAQAAAKCPTCMRESTHAQVSGQKPSPGDRYRDLAREWHPWKNDALRPEQFTPGAVRRVWWRCSTNPLHEWDARIYTRTRHGGGCPFCKNTNVTATTSFAARFPELVEEWHDSRNGALIPHDILPTSKLKVWWRCKQYAWHKWRASVSERVLGRGCPVCSSAGARRVSALSVRHPEAAREWHPTKNGSLTPGMLTATSTTIVWWRCSRDPCHEWRATPNQRIRRGNVCPICGEREPGDGRHVDARFRGQEDRECAPR